ncbi:GntR family transcriptional regulator [Streptomyces sp. SPB162]|uniref:GntR family transcriptional regulator n=1 Tax=Streptomyces sp. SPB162 TaxID=2940560 RepID=UPI00240688D2|nr:GntR family transcriptional regulator [Streptomyces sp. SPB162]MDF9815212.1 GntR family transcriptional regulator [Streptomyces sp. SPB162]
MPGDIIRPSAMYRQLADRLADSIAAGDFPPGTVLPSETQLMERYKVSRPTVRAAVAELRTMGLVESQHGKGTFVRRPSAPTTSIQRTITRSGKTFTAGQQQFTEIEPPTVTRTETIGAAAAFLERDEEAAFAVDRLLVEATTHARASHRTVIPFDVAERFPSLAEEPNTAPAEIYGLFAAAGQVLEWSETVTARSPFPDERTTLNMPESAPILITHRVTHGTDGRPLLLEELKVSAEQARLTFRVTADKTPPKRAG